MKEVFNEISLGEEIKKIWGEYGAHYEVYKMVLDKNESLTSQNTILKETLEVFEKDREVLVSALNRIAECCGLPLDGLDATGFTKIAKQALQQVTKP